MFVVRMFILGVVMLGFNYILLYIMGFWEENFVILGVGFILSIVFVGRIFVMGVGVECM